MTPEERDLIDGLFQRLRSVDNAAKDADAATLIARNVQAQPEAPYMLVQTVLVQEHALTNAQARIAELEQQLAQAKQGQSQSGGSFLSGGGLGPWGRAPAQAQPPAYTQQPYYPPQPAYPTTAMMPQSAGGGFLSSALTTAAGVAGGALLFEGISNLLGHNAGPFGPGLASYGGYGGGFGGPREEIIEENVTNNYYGSDPNQGQQADYQPDQSDDYVSDADFDDSDSGDFGGDDGGFV